MTEAMNQALEAAINAHQQGQIEQAENLYLKILEAKPNQADTLHLLGVLYLQTERKEQALKCLREAVQHQPNHPSFQSNLGAAYQANNQIDLAISHYQQALRLQPNYFNASYNLGLCYLAKENYQQAKEYLEQALALEPSESYILADLANIYKVMNQRNRAIACLRQAIELEPNNVDWLQSLANLLEETEQLNEAIAIYEKLLSVQPEKIPLLNSYGLLLAQSKEYDKAIHTFKSIIELSPTFDAAYVNLGTLLFELDEIEEAIKYFHLALEIQPNKPRIYQNLAASYRKLGQLDQAIDYYHIALALDPNYVEAEYSLATLLTERKYRKIFGLSGFLDAEIHLSKIVGLKPDYAEVYFQAGCNYMDQLRYKLAVPLLEKALQYKPDFALAYNNLGLAYRGLKDEEAEEIQYRQALILDPELGEAYSNLGLILSNQKRYVEALPVLEEAVRYKPDFFEAHRALGTTYKELNRLEESVQAFRRALELKPDDPSAYAGLAGTYLAQCCHDDAIYCYRKSAKLAPGLIAFHGNILMGLHYAPDFDPIETFREHKKWGDAYQASVANLRKPYHRNRELDRPIKIGYISGDFKLHSVSMFFEHLYSNHDHEQFKIYCYSNNPKDDLVTKRMREKADVWHDIFEIKSDQEVADLIAKDEIDILVDLAGHTGYNRLHVLALKPAPIQATYLGYPDTTGLDLVDYRITDPYADPPGMTEQYHSEKLIRFPSSFLCYNPINEFPPVSPLPSLSAGLVTFGCCNNPTKITPNVIEVWAEILNRLSNSRILLKNARYSDQSIREIFWNRFEKYDIPRDRVLLVSDRQGILEHLTIYQEIDIGLDPFPYNGTTTTCETLWGGSPVIVLAGNAHVCRVGVSILTNVGLPELIAATPEEYVDIAVKLGSNPGKLQHIRENLRPMMNQSPLRDASAQTRALEQIYKQMWKTLVVSGK